MAFSFTIFSIMLCNNGFRIKLGPKQSCNKHEFTFFEFMICGVGTFIKNSDSVIEPLVHQ